MLEQEADILKQEYDTEAAKKKKTKNKDKYERSRSKEKPSTSNARLTRVVSAVNMIKLIIIKLVCSKMAMQDTTT